MSPRTWVAIQLGKSINFILKKSGRGATAAPGYYALKLDPNLLKTLAKDLDKIIILTGTNGKTTTSRLLATILQENKQLLIHNRAGSNLTRGLVSTLIAHQPLKGGTAAIFEVDEATIPEVLDQITPDLLIVTNLFRDQLDRYGEVAKIHSVWKKALGKLPQTTTLVLNSDDPNVADLGSNLDAQVVYFGLDDRKVSFRQAPHTIDARLCPLDGKPLRYDYYYLSHLGGYHCTGHDFRRPEPLISAVNIKLSSIESSEMTINFHGPRLAVSLPISGIYNLYNALSAAAAAHELGIEKDHIKKGLETYESAFGRQQTLKVGNSRVSLNLVKNPVGYNEVLRLLETESDPLHLFLLLNDNLADGTDVSWIWDVDFENLKGKIASLTISGTRALELANRLKYATLFTGETKLESETSQGLKTAVQALKSGETLYILPTYTAMLDLQKLLKSGGHTQSFWES